MRPRIKNRVDVQSVISDLDRRREVYSSAIRELMADGFSYPDAKKWVNGIRTGMESEAGKKAVSDHLWNNIKLEIKRQGV